MLEQFWLGPASARTAKGITDEGARRSRQGQDDDGFTEHIALLVIHAQELEAVLKTLMVAHLCHKLYDVQLAGKVKLQLQRVAGVQLAGNDGPQATFADVLSTTVKDRIRPPQEQALIHAVSTTESWYGPRLYAGSGHENFLRDHNIKLPSCDTRKVLVFSKEIRVREGSGYCPPSLLSAQRACSATTGSSSVAKAFRSGPNSRLPLLPMATAAFLRSPARLARRMGEPRNCSR